MIKKIRYGKSTIQYTVFKTSRVKTSQIDVTANNVLVRTPISKKDSEIRKMIKEKSQWIYLKQLQFKKQQLEISKNLYKNYLIYRGKSVFLKIKTNQKMDLVSYSKGKFLVKLTKNYSKQKLKKLYNDWVFHKASKILTVRSHKLSSIIGIRPSKIQIKLLKTRWGSATEKGVINLNSNLLKAPQNVIDYIIIHELCHLKIKGHSFRFWSLVAKHSPNYKYHEIWLKDFARLDQF